MARTARNKPENIQEANEGQEALENVTSFYDKNKKQINTAFAIVVLLIGGILGYIYLYKKPNEQKAATAISYPQRLFMADSTDLALNGDGQHGGFLNIIRKYKGSDAANLSHYYAGLCYLKLGDYGQAIKYLKDFNGKGTNLAYTAWGALGDAYMENNDVKNGIKYYNKAAGNPEDDVFAPVYLYRAGIAYEMDGQPEKAKDAYKRIRDEYPQSTAAQSIDKDLARLGVVE